MSSSDFPTELSTPVATLHSAITTLDTALAPLLDNDDAPTRQEQTGQLDSPLERAQLDLALLFALNSLSWVWLKTQGVNPKAEEGEHQEAGEALQAELTRVKSALRRAQEIKEKEKRVRVDTEAAKRFVASGIWKPGDRKQKYNSTPPSAGGNARGGRGGRGDRGGAKRGRRN